MLVMEVYCHYTGGGSCTAVAWWHAACWQEGVHVGPAAAAADRGHLDGDHTRQ